MSARGNPWTVECPRCHAPRSWACSQLRDPSKRMQSRMHDERHELAAMVADTRLRNWLRAHASMFQESAR